MWELLSQPETYFSFLTLAAMEIILGIDNIVFITILVGRLPPQKQVGARRLGIGLALVSRLGLLFSISWVMSLKEVWFTLFDHGFSGKDLVLLFGGLFLVFKATREIYENVEHPEEPAGKTSSVRKAGPNVTRMMIEIIFVDIVFSLDSVITAVGMVEQVSIMVAAMIVAVGVMMMFAGPVGNFVQRHASVRVLALAFLVLIGVLLIGEGMGQHFPKGYIYFAMAFSLSIELINMRMRARHARRKAADAAPTT